MFLEPKTG